MRIRMLLWLLSSLAGPLAAQKPGFPVRGVILSQDGQPVAGAEVLLESSRLSTRSDTLGRFRLDSVPAGSHRLLIRRIGYLALHPPVSVPQEARDTLHVILLQVAQQLAPIMVEAGRRGIRGVVGDTAYHAIPGAVVEILGARRDTVSDDRGRFAFENLREGHYMMRVSRAGYVARLVNVDLKSSGQEYSIFLHPFAPGSFDWADSREAAIALPDLAIRLALEPRRTRMTRAELDRYGSMPLCEIPRVHSIVGDAPQIIFRGMTWWRNANLCAWSADQVDLLEWGSDPCKEAWGSIAEVLMVNCGPQQRVNLYSVRGAPRPSYVVIWPRE